MAFEKSKLFFYGACSEDKVTEMADSLVNDGCTLFQVISGMIPHPNAKFALGNQPQLIAIYRFLVTAPESVYRRLQDASQKPNLNVQ